MPIHQILSAVFLEQRDLLATEGTRLTESATTLVTPGTDPRLQQTLQGFIQQFQQFLDQAAVVSNLSQDLERSDAYLESRLQELDSTIRNTAIMVKMDERDISGLERLGHAVPRYRETLLWVNSAFARIIQGYLRVAEEDERGDEGFLQLLVKLDEWDAELQPLLMSEPAVQELGEILVDTVRSHKEAMVAFYRELTTFQEHLQALNNAQHQVLMVMEDIDTEIQQTTTRLKSTIHQVVFSAQRLALIFSVVILVVMVLGWWGIRRMIRPLLQVARIAEQVAAGDIDCDVSQIQRPHLE